MVEQLSAVEKVIYNYFKNKRNCTLDTRAGNWDRKKLELLLTMKLPFSFPQSQLYVTVCQNNFDSVPNL